MKSIEVTLSMQKNLFQEHCDGAIVKELHSADIWYLLAADTRVNIDRETLFLMTECRAQLAFDNASLREL